MTTTIAKAAPDLETRKPVRSDYINHDWWTTAEAADYAQVSTVAVRGWMDQNYFPHRSKFTRFRVYGPAFIRFIDTGEVQLRITSPQSTT